MNEPQNTGNVKKESKTRGKWRYLFPVIRLNVETRGNKKLLGEKTQELLKEIGGEPA